MNRLEIKNLHVDVEGAEILKGVDLSVKKGEVVAVMGPNGSGKSTLAYSLAGHPNYSVTKGEMVFDGQELNEMSPDKRARLGLFLGFQYPQEIGGVSLANFLRTAMNSGRSEKIPVRDFIKALKENLSLLEMDESFSRRYLNEGFSGGEKKRAEILQMAMLRPKMAVLDETDSGLDITSLKIVAEGINKIKDGNMSVVLITHYQRFLNYIKPDRIVIMSGGRVVKEGSSELAAELERKGYDDFK